MQKRISLSLLGLFICTSSLATTSKSLLQPPIIKSPLRSKNASLKKQIQADLQATTIQSMYSPVDQGPHFDLPITYNSKVRSWVKFFQKEGRKDFHRWLERSARYIPKITPTLQNIGLPKDLAYLAMIESGFSSQAVSSAAAVGYWQFIKPTAKRYGLQIEWWLDERRDIVKSTVAAAAYLNDLYKMFDSWYLAAAAYNMGEGRVKKLIKKYQTKNYWVLSRQKDFPTETEQYIPKLLAALLISKSPSLYGFKDLKLQDPMDYDYFNVPGGTDLDNLSYYIGADKQLVKRLNPELIKGFVPQFITSHRIRIPRGNLTKASEFIRASL